MQQATKKYDLEIELPDFVDEDRHGYGAAIVGEITYKIVDVVDADTPLGRKIGQSIEIVDEDITIFVSDQDGGSLYDDTTDLESHGLESEVMELILRSKS